MRPKRQSLACIQCSKRKVKCDKKIPCKNCLRRNVGHLCHRPFDGDKIYDKIRDVAELQKVGSEELTQREKVDEKKNPFDVWKRQLRSENTATPTPATTLFNNASIENYLSSLRSLTFGYTHLSGLLPEENGEKHECVSLERLTSKLTYKTSYLLCSFACRYTTFLHFGVVDQLFMKDHEEFWRDEENKSLWQIIGEMGDKNRDFQFWMSLYYAMLCVGVYFGVDSLQEELPYGSVEQQELPRVLFRASLDWLEKTDFIEKPDIRTIQVYCVMTTCLHALGSVYISKQLLHVVVGMAGVLRLDNIEDDERQPLNFQKEIAKRLWYSFFIVDSVSNVPRRLIGEFSTPFPRLVSTNELLGRSEDRELGYSNQYGSRSDDISGLLYERLMAQMSQIKQDSYRDKLTGLTDAWCRMNKLKDQLDKYFGSSPYSITDNRIGQFAKYLLFSSLARECLGLSARLLTQTGKDFWQRNFRSDCLKLALELVAHNSLKDTPPYYKRYWIVGQHLIYACLFVLLDMLMFSQKNCEENLSRIKNAIPTVRSLRSTHYTVRMGLAVIEKLYYLVSSVRLRGSVGAAGSAGTVEDFSLREFLRDLQVATIDNNTAQIPSPTESQYLRRGKRGELGNLEEKKVNEVQIENSPIAPSQSFLDPELDGLLDETGWKEFLGFFFGGQNEMGDTRQ